MFRVRWADTALNALAELWTQANSALRNAITAASGRIDELPLHDPVGCSESRPHGRRILFEFPLGIIFRIEPDGRTVSVLRVWLVRPAGQS